MGIKDKEVAEIKALQHNSKVRALKEQLNRVKQDQDTNEEQEQSLKMKAEKDEIKHKIQIMKMKQSFDELTTNSPMKNEQKEKMLSGDLLYDEFIDLNEVVEEEEEEEEKMSKQPPIVRKVSSVAIEDYVSMDIMTMRKELLKLAKPKLIKLC